MDKKLTRRAIIASARKDIKSLPRPTGVRLDNWYYVREALLCLAGSLPDPYPSVRTLAKKLGWHKTTVHRVVSKARSLGLLETTSRSFGEDHWDGMTYLLTCLSDTTKAAIVRSRPGPKCVQEPVHTSGLKVVPSSSKKESSPIPPSEGCAHGSGSALADQTQRAAVTRRGEFDDEPEVTLGGDPTPKLRSSVVKPPDPAKMLALHFDDRWQNMARRSQRFRGIPGSKRGMAIGYIKGVMLTQVDPDIARAHMDAFVSAVASGEVELNDEQLPFERFTGWWGRQQVVDPAETARLNEIKAVLAQRREEFLRRTAAEDAAAALDSDD